MIEETEPSVEEMNKKLRNYLKIYNFLRPHKSLDYKTPAEKFFDYINFHQGVHHVVNSNTRLTPKLDKFILHSASGDVAQVVRAGGSYPPGRWFDSTRRHH